MYYAKTKEEAVYMARQHGTLASEEIESEEGTDKDVFYQGKPKMEPETDKDGKPVLKTDKDGKPIQKRDEKGKPVYDKDGKPEYEIKMRRMRENTIRKVKKMEHYPKYVPKEGKRENPMDKVERNGKGNNPMD